MDAKFIYKKPSELSLPMSIYYQDVSMYGESSNPSAWLTASQYNVVLQQMYLNAS